MNITTEYTTWNGKECILQAAVIDLDGDGLAERITAYFTDDSLTAVNSEPLAEHYDTCEVIITNPAGGLYTFIWSHENMKPQLNFADFDTGDSLIQFFLEGDGPSGDPFAMKTIWMIIQRISKMNLFALCLRKHRLLFWI